MAIQKDITKLLNNKNIMMGIEFEFLIPKVSNKDSKRMRKWTELSVANYEYEVYEEELGRYIDRERITPPKLPKYVSGLNFKDGDIIPEPHTIIKKPTQPFLQLVDEYLNISDWPIERPVVTENDRFRRKDRWIVKPDFSLSKDGFEIVSPVMPLKDSLKMIPKILKCIDKYGVTDKSCGIHFNISVKNMNMKEKVDTTKLSAFINEPYIYKLFPKRRNNDYAKSMHEDLKINVKEEKRCVSSHGHCLAVNYEHLLEKNKYIEFRYIGGTKYHQRWKDIRKILAVYIYALKISYTNKFKDEFTKNIEKIIGRK